MYNEHLAARAVAFISSLKHTKGVWYGKNFELLPWQNKIIRDVFGTVKGNGYRQYNTAYVEIPKKQGKSELAAAVALYLLAGDGEWGGEVYGCAADRQQASIVFDVACQMVEQCPALKRRVKPIMSQKRLIYTPLNSFYQVLSAEAYCMRPDTKLTNMDGSIVLAGDVKVGDSLLGYANGLKNGKVISVEKQAARPIYRITTVRGRRIEVTGKHRFFTMTDGRRACDLTHEYRWIQAKDLHVGQRIKVALGNCWIGKEPTEPELLESWSLGAWAGDGECGRFRFISADDEIVRKLRRFMESIGSSLESVFSTRQLKGDNKAEYPYEHIIKGIGKRRKCSGREWIRTEYGQESRAGTKKVPAKIFLGGPKIWSAFLAGYLDTDGNVPAKTRLISFTSNSSELLEGCQELFARLGINASLNRCEGFRHNRLTISGREQLAKAYEVLSPYVSLSRKKELLYQKGLGGLFSFHAHDSDRIAAIDVLAEAETVSLEIEDIHTHITNGLVSHNSKHGLNVHGVVFDELHAQPDRRLYDVMTHGSGDARKQPLFFLITTAGTDRNSICWEVHQKSKDILEGRKHDSSFYPVIYGAADEEDWTDEKVWAKANPSLGITVDIDKLRTACESAKENPAEENLFRQLRLNQWVKQSVRWMPMEAWDKCAFEVDPEKLKDRECYGGLDLSSSTDVTAFVLVFPPTAEDDKYYVLPFFWIPEDTIAQRVRRDHVPYDIWERQGCVISTEGNVIHYGYIENFIENLGMEYNIKEIAFDRWGAVQMTQNLEGMGFTVVPFGQGFKDMSPPTKELMKLVLEQKIAHGGNVPLRWMMDNVFVRTDPAGNIKMDKEKSTERIDGAVALVMALDRAIRNNSPTESVYNDRGIIVIG